jgi:hypothetical protein
MPIPSASTEVMMNCFFIVAPPVGFHCPQPTAQFAHIACGMDFLTSSAYSAFNDLEVRQHGEVDP